ncbi:MAG: DUF2971 domain-containing protein [Methylobacter sp.]|uniref:DUF2971 domain-containing protein n=1 Tax=Methylobacter sp. TaxID=2051955 RepID=UPI0027317F82|nr:DUF2971 domain-containing protein [Methylobacter sp.]MDP1665260.1 DUF2971 domain-containing protein [Methylobacter sp.]
MKKPSSFFKFVTKERTDILKKGMIRFTQPADFNDPFELNPCVTHFTRDWIERGSTELEYSQADLDFSTERFHQIEEHRSIIEKYASEHGVLSLSASYDTNPNPALFLGYEDDPRRNLLMWAHYCDKHTGFAIEFHPHFIAGEAERESSIPMKDLFAHLRKFAKTPIAFIFKRALSGDMKMSGDTSILSSMQITETNLMSTFFESTRNP